MQDKRMNFELSDEGKERAVSYAKGRSSEIADTDFCLFENGNVLTVCTNDSDETLGTSAKWVSTFRNGEQVSEFTAEETEEETVSEPAIDENNLPEHLQNTNENQEEQNNG